MIARVLLIVIFSLLHACATKQDISSPLAVSTPAAKSFSEPRVVLVLGSGGARGYAHLGVLQALEEANIPVDAIVGSSAGSVIATLYADNQSFQKTYDIMMPAGFWDFADVGNLTGSGGIIKGHQLQKFMIKNMNARNFDQLQKKVIVAATDMESGELYPIENGPIAPAVVASSAIPGVVKPINLNGRTLIDGGVLSPVPVELARKLHPKIIIAVDISKKSGANKPSSAVGDVDSAVYIMGQRLTQISLNDADVVISPKIGDVSLFDISKKREMYLAGLHAARQEIPKIRKLLEETNTITEAT